MTNQSAKSAVIAKHRAGKGNQKKGTVIDVKHYSGSPLKPFHYSGSALKPFVVKKRFSLLAASKLKSHVYSARVVEAELVDVTLSGLIVAVDAEQVTYTFRVSKVSTYRGEPFVDAGLIRGATLKLTKHAGEVLDVQVAR